MGEKVYYVIQNGQPRGPFSLEDLRAFSLRADDFVKREGDPDYTELEEHKEISDLLGISYRRTPPQYYASLDMRLLAWAIDFMLVFFCYCVLFAIPVLLWETDDKQAGSLLLGAAGIPIVLFLMGLFCEPGRFMGTPGKRLLKIKVSGLNGTPISFSQSLLRNLFKILGFASLGLFFFIGFFDRKQQCLHDKIAATLVIKDRLI